MYTIFEALILNNKNHRWRMQKNGEIMVNSAQGRISAVNPFTGNDTITYFGNIIY